MKVAKVHKSGAVINHIQAKRQPFFNQEGQGSFFSKSNQATSSFFSPAIIQPKVTIGQPNDKYEVEADAMADKVVQRLSTNNESISNIGYNGNAAIQTKGDSCEEEEKFQKKEEPLANEINSVQLKPIFESNAEQPDADIQSKPLTTSVIQTKCSSCEQEEKLQKKEEEQLPDGELSLQRKTSDQPSENTPDLESRLNSSKGGGSSLPADIQSSIGSTFGADFSGVRIHTDREAVQMNQEIGAQAFTHGSDIYFNQGKYDTNSTQGKRLLAHELTHTVQQTNITQRKTIQKVPCLNSVTCANNSGAPGTFSAHEEAAEAPDRAAIASATPASITASGHGRRAVTIERIINFYRSAYAFPNTPSILGIFVDDPLSEGTGAIIHECPSFTASVPGLACGTKTHLIGVHNEMEMQAATYLASRENPSTMIPFGPASWGVSFVRSQWLTNLMGMVRHEMQHVHLDAAIGAGTISGEGTCTMSTNLPSGEDVAYNLSEISSVLSEFQIIEKAFRRGKLNTSMHAEELDAFRSSVVPPSSPWAQETENVGGAIKDIKCTCICADADQLLINNFNFTTSGWSRPDKTNLNLLLRTNLGALWPVFVS